MFLQLHPYCQGSNVAVGFSFYGDRLLLGDVLFGFVSLQLDLAEMGPLFAERTVSKRILIADDHESVLRALRLLLTKPGWEICGDAADGNEAVAKAIELSPDLIILDLVMPRMNGLKAGQVIKKVLPTAPIVINTLYRTAAVEAEANKHGIRKVVDKGNAGALISAVEELLGAA